MSNISNNSPNKKVKLPPLMRVSNHEANCVVNLFRIYDHKLTGKIPNYLAVKIMATLGYDISKGSFTSEVTVQEILMLLDTLIPEPEPVLMSSLTSFKLLAAEYNREGVSGPVITPQCISEFMVSLGRTPASISEASLMLNSMLEYDDCSETPVVSAEIFSKDLINFAKKHNAFKDYHH